MRYTVAVIPYTDATSRGALYSHAIIGEMVIAATHCEAIKQLAHHPITVIDRKQIARRLDEIARAVQHVRSVL